jgi:uncharacterized protein (UPF0262 family)
VNSKPTRSYYASLLLVTLIESYYASLRIVTPIEVTVLFMGGRMGIFLDCQGDILDRFDLLATGISCEMGLIGLLVKLSWENLLLFTLMIS